METKYLDETIGNLDFFKAQNELTEKGEEKLNEFKAIKQALSQHDVSGRSEQLKALCDNINPLLEPNVKNFTVDDLRDIIKSL